ncbi:hypothetical protein GGX14DRAFT_558814 [Mycena pura]|uniref:Cytochrome P450 n=1 Tax=Mycena pura TaxID=153505 RepID=A0AAD6VT94_9AGAR|nr:hypothetical protein GGX14DRAFT_558814 [Mycena pura]
MLRVSLCLAAVFVAYRAVLFLSALHAHGYVKGALLDPHENAIPSIWWHMGFKWPWIRLKHGACRRRQRTRLLTTCRAPHARPHDLDPAAERRRVLRGVGCGRAAGLGERGQDASGETQRLHEGEVRLALASFARAVVECACSVWGSSVAFANGDDWKRHRRVVAPAFTQKMFSRIVEESALVYDQMKVLLLLRFTFVTICRLIVGLAAAHPKARPRLIPLPAHTHRACSLRKIDDSWKTTGAVRRPQISQRGEDLQLFTKLVPSTDGAVKYALEPPDVPPRAETTGSALMSTLVLLGLHPEEQDAAYAEIIREIPSAETMAL